MEAILRLIDAANATVNETYLPGAEPMETVDEPHKAVIEAEAWVMKQRNAGDVDKAVVDKLKDLAKEGNQWT